MRGGGGGGGFPVPSVGIEAAPDAGQKADANLPHAILQELNELNRRESRGSEILMLDVSGLADRFDMPIERVQDVLSDMLLEGLVEPHYPTMGQGPMEGALRITASGLSALRNEGSV